MVYFLPMRYRSTSPAKRGRHRIAIGSMTVLLALVAAVLVGVRLRQGSSRSLPATPTIDRRLIVHAHTVPVTGILGGATVRGTLYPGLPGSNTVHLTVHGLDMTSSSPSLTLVATMPGMRMVGVTARLRAKHGAYSGTIPLVMFGTYTATISLPQGGTVRHGMVRLSLPLTLGQ